MRSMRGGSGSVYITPLPADEAGVCIARLPILWTSKVEGLVAVDGLWACYMAAPVMGTTK